MRTTREFTLPGGKWIEITAGSHSLPGGQRKNPNFLGGHGNRDEAI
jgi:hypothetical protein